MRPKKHTEKKKRTGNAVTVFEAFACNKAARQFINALSILVYDQQDANKLTGCLFTKFTKVLQSDPQRPGKRWLDACNLKLIEGFNFYEKKPAVQKIPVTPIVRINRRYGKCTVSIPSFTPNSLLAPNCDATHFTIKAAAIAPDFRKASFSVFTGNSIALPVAEATAVAFGFSAPRGTSLPLVVVIAMHLHKVVQGEYLPVAGQSLQVAYVDMSHSDKWKNAPALLTKTGRKRIKQIV